MGAGDSFDSRNVQNSNVFSDCDQSNTVHSGAARDSFNREIDATNTGLAKRDKDQEVM